ncbi:hypothetical protein JMJ78_0000881 [Colletotrichum scovillei]|nr:hypothetical protein JMJ78_0000881 [Colletotrichum scovillei]
MQGESQPRPASSTSNTWVNAADFQKTFDRVIITKSSLLRSYSVLSTSRPL